MTKISLLIAIISVITLVDMVMGILYVPADEWNAYKQKYGKVYTKHPFGEAYAQYYYAYNKKMIDKHNALYERGLRTYKLGINQFTDMRFIHFKALFPPAISLSNSNDKQPPEVRDAAPEYDPITMFGLKTNIEDQGVKCNSGWAYAVAKCIEITNFMQDPQNPSLRLSAQNLIDCAGRSKACKNQVPQSAFDYLTVHNADLHSVDSYPNKKNEMFSGMCAPKSSDQAAKVVKVESYAKIKNGDDESLMKYVSNNYPAVIEFDPTSFEFMHYSEGIFQQPISHKGSHFMVVIGYGEDKKINQNGLKYWQVQNSFGPNWGEGGFIRIHRTPNAKIAKNALLVSEMGVA
ncbi:cathepsin L-like proteinase [Cochliomyia hominivorax]